MGLHLTGRNKTGNQQYKHSLSFLLNQEIEIHITDFEHFFMFLDDCALEKRVRGNNGIDFFSSSAAPPTHQNTNVL